MIPVLCAVFLFELSIGNFVEAFEALQPTQPNAVKAAAIAALHPRITPAPVRHALRPRASNANICGYVNGLSSNPISCQEDNTCQFNRAVSIHGGYGVVECCGPNGCAYQVACVEPQQISSRCDEACIDNSLILKCTQSPYTYCNYYHYSAFSILDYGCGLTRSNGIQSIYPYYTDRGGYSVAVVFDNNMPPDINQTKSVTIPVPVPNVAATTASTTASSLTPDSTAQPAQSQNHTGAIVGGVVGGLAVLAIFCLAIVLLVWRRHRKAKPATAEGAVFLGHEEQKPNIYDPVQQQEVGLAAYKSPTYDPSHNPHISGQGLPPQSSSAASPPQGSYLVPQATGYPFSPSRSPQSTEYTPSTTRASPQMLPTGFESHEAGGEPHEIYELSVDAIGRGDEAVISHENVSPASEIKNISSEHVQGELGRI